MDDYIESMDDALKFMKEKAYSNIFIYCHSTGALVFLNYYIKRKEKFFSGVIFNGPFLDMGHVGGEFYELILENISIVSNLTGKSYILQNVGGKVSKWQTMRWILYQWSLVQ